MHQKKFNNNCCLFKLFVILQMLNCDKIFSTIHTHGGELKDVKNKIRQNVQYIERTDHDE